MKNSISITLFYCYTVSFNICIFTAILCFYRHLKKKQFSLSWKSFFFCVNVFSFFLNYTPLWDWRRLINEYSCWVIPQKEIINYMYQKICLQSTLIHIMTYSRIITYYFVNKYMLNNCLCKKPQCEVQQINNYVQVIKHNIIVFWKLQHRYLV